MPAWTSWKKFAGNSKKIWKILWNNSWISKEILKIFWRNHFRKNSGSFYVKICGGVNSVFIFAEISEGTRAGINERNYETICGGIHTEISAGTLKNLYPWKFPNKFVKEYYKNSSRNFWHNFWRNHWRNFQKKQWKNFSKKCLAKFLTEYFWMDGLFLWNPWKTLDLG